MHLERMVVWSTYRMFGAKLKPTLTAYQSNRLDTDCSSAVRLMASPNRSAIEITRMLWAVSMAVVGSIELVITSSFNFEDVMRETAPPDRTPWEI